MNPEKNPIKKRNASSIHGPVANAIEKVRIPIPIPARIRFAFWPNLSAKIPHIGAMIAPDKKAAEKIAPVQTLSAFSPVTPNSSKYNGKKGKIIVIAATIIKLHNQRKRALLRQFFI
jgi:hypothetical protein